MFPFSCKKSPTLAVENLPELPRSAFLAKKRHNEALVVVVIVGCFGLWGAGSFFGKAPDVVHAPMRAIPSHNPSGFGMRGLNVRPEFILEHSEPDVVGGMNFIESAIAGQSIVPQRVAAATDEERNCVTKRAKILDRQGQLLAGNVQKSQLQFQLDVYHFQDDAERAGLAQRIVEIIPTKVFDDVMWALKKQKGYVYVAAGLSPRQALELKSLEDRYGGMIRVTSHASRVYPKNDLFAHVVGSIKEDYCPLSGLEMALDDQIAGQDKAVRLSLDEGIQHIVADELARGMTKTNAIGAMALVQDVRSGQIVSRVSLPTYNINQKNYLSNHFKTAFFAMDNDHTTDMFEVGSVFKIFNTALALEQGVDLYRVFETRKRMTVGRHLIVEDHPERFNLNMLGIFLRSNNRGSAKIALEAGHKKQVELFARLGLIAPGDLDKPGKRGSSSVANRSFGYGLYTNLEQIATATASLVNGGTRIKPVYLQNQSGLSNRRVFAVAHSETLRRIMLTNVTHVKGTAKRAYRPGVLLGGKTSTAKYHVEAQGEVRAHYSDDTRATFVGVFPMDAPRYVVVATLLKPINERGKPANAGEVTAPVVGDIARRIALAEGLLRDPDWAREYETMYSLPYQHNPVRVAQN
ncbi:MAG: penicillin-binding protein 2 [Alphaproteobacteria bacterium]|nr:penicillin-binding protein 2 [Alphaproteobacteria bacterium]